MAVAPVFKDSSLQRHYEEFGYVSFSLLSPAVIREVNEAYGGLPVEDKYGIGYRISLFNSDLETRRKARDRLIERVFPALEPLLVDRYPYLATYMVKEAGGRPIPAHQDWTHCDEARHDSVMCWIALCDVDARRGGLGFINGSHKYFDYLRVFPYHVAKAPSDRYGPELMPYLQFPALRAGDAVVFNNRTIHGSLANDGSGSRGALGFGLHPRSEPLLLYYLKPGIETNAVLRYEASPELYLEYPNPNLTELYNAGRVIPGHDAHELPYHMPAISWEELQAKLNESGNSVNPEIAEGIRRQAARATNAAVVREN
jgi:hypothetical protein